MLERVDLEAECLRMWSRLSVYISCAPKSFIDGAAYWESVLLSKGEEIRRPTCCKPGVTPVQIQRCQLS